LLNDTSLYPPFFVVTCQPTLHEKNSCGYYSSQIKIFGYGIGETVVQHTLDTVRAALPGSLANAAKSGAVRLVLVDSMTKAVSLPGIDNGSSGADKALGAGATAGLVLALSVLFLGVGVLGVYCFAHLRRMTGRQKLGKKGRHRMDFSRYFDTNSLTNTYQATESDESEPRPPLHASITSSRGRDKTNRTKTETDPSWRPIIVEFGPSFDPERDRYLKELEDESSAPPTYAQNLAMSSDFSVRDIQIV